MKNFLTKGLEGLFETRFGFNDGDTVHIIYANRRSQAIFMSHGIYHHNISLVNQTVNSKLLPGILEKWNKVLLIEKKYKQISKIVP